MADYAFHPDALLEYADATSHYLREASPRVAERFVAAVESAIGSILTAPDRWRVVDEPDISRFVFSRFPYVLYYRWDTEKKFVTILAVMHAAVSPDTGSTEASCHSWRGETTHAHGVAHRSQRFSSCYADRWSRR